MNTFKNNHNDSNRWRQLQRPIMLRDPLHHSAPCNCTSTLAKRDSRGRRRRLLDHQPSTSELIGPKVLMPPAVWKPLCVSNTLAAVSAIVACLWKNRWAESRPFCFPRLDHLPADEPSSLRLVRNQVMTRRGSWELCPLVPPWTGGRAGVSTDPK